MQKGYLFIANSTKPTPNKANSLQPYTIGTFGYAPVKAANDMGYKLYFGLNRDTAEQVKCTNFDIQFYNAHIYRDVFAFKDNWIAYKNLVKLLKEHPEIEVIHCNTPIGGLLGRICGHKFKKTVIYTAHGFHFYKGAPKKNWLLYYPIERFLAHWTDAIITINDEDFEAAKKFHYKKGGKAYYIPGVGVELESYSIDEIERKKVREGLNLKNEDVAAIVVGDLNQNKNVETIIRAIGEAKTKIHLLICGMGPLENELKSLAVELGVDKYCHFLGFRTDIKVLYTVSDIFINASQREGLPRSTMEAMLAGLPCIVSSIRGNVDLIENHKGGIQFAPKDSKALAGAINTLAVDVYKRAEYGAYNLKRIKLYDIEKVNKQMLDIYKEVCR